MGAARDGLPGRRPAQVGGQRRAARVAVGRLLGQRPLDDGLDARRQVVPPLADRRDGGVDVEHGLLQLRVGLIGDVAGQHFV